VHIIVDGYNLIRQSPELRRFERAGLEAGRKALIHRLSIYRRFRGHAITVVFDGWQTGALAEERTREGSMTIIFSRKGEKADDVIRRLAGKGGREVMVVTSDRELAYAIGHAGAMSVPSGRFEEIMNRSGGANERAGKDCGGSGDSLPPSSGTKKKGPSRKAPRKRRAALTRISRL
jgi:predicted RNA-binding protein with PIN domain